MLLKFNKTPTKLSKDKQANVFRIPPPLSPKPSKSVLTKSKFYKKNQSLKANFNSNNKLYVQAFEDNINKIIKIKNAFPKISLNKVTEIYKSSYLWVQTMLKELWPK